jgi:2-oxoglutarate ferredoxin oxidoreductase subunit alpha
VSKQSPQSVRFLSGNMALVEGSVKAGCRFYAGYPITPSTEIAESFARRMPQIGGVYIQMEDEIGSIGAVLGASWAGAKSMTATSGPGFSLMMEHIGLAVMLETPCVIVDVQRGGPSTGLPTLPAQSDVMQARWGSHGTYEIIAVSPNSPNEAYTLAIKAFNLSERYRVPVIMLMDECVGHMYEKVRIPAEDQITILNRKTPHNGEHYLPYEPNDDLIPPMAIAGEGFHFHVTGLTHDERGYPVATREAQNKYVLRLSDKIRKNEEKIREVEQFLTDDAEVVVVSFGITSRPAIRAVRTARQEGLKVGLIRLVTIWPFPEKTIRDVARTAKGFVVAEMNYGQIFYEVERCAGGKPVILSPNLGGEAHTSEEILDKIRQAN